MSTLQKLMGTWYVDYSTLEFWQKGGRKNPRIEYTNLKEGAKATDAVWTDAVYYDQPTLFSSTSKPRSIVGYDTVTSSDSRQFRWIGAGLLRVLRSDCKVCSMCTTIHHTAVSIRNTSITPFTGHATSSEVSFAIHLR